MQSKGDVAEASARLEAAGVASRVAGLRSVVLGGDETVVVSIPLIAAVLAEPSLDARAVGVDEDATPPGYTAR